MFSLIYWEKTWFQWTGSIWEKRIPEEVADNENCLSNVGMSPLRSARLLGAAAVWARLVSGYIYPPAPDPSQPEGDPTFPPGRNPHCWGFLASRPPLPFSLYGHVASKYHIWKCCNHFLDLLLGRHLHWIQHNHTYPLLCCLSPDNRTAFRWITAGHRSRPGL